ncbi:chemotaxis protein CheW, partial [Candidatus Riflebacteria bacterium]
PRAQPFYTGLINLRGQIIPAVNLRKRLGFAENEPGFEPINLIVMGNDGPLCIQVDQVGDVLDVSLSLYENAPPTVDQKIAAFIEGVCKLPEELLIILDIPALTA